MNLANFLQELAAQGVELWVEGERLRYRAPKEALTATLFNKLKQHKAELIQWLRSDGEQRFPLSHGQQALWFLYQSAPQSPVYNVSFSVRIHSPVDVPALRHAFQMLIERHPALRTTFVSPNKMAGAPWQEVHAAGDLYFEQIDGTAWSEEQLREQVKLAHERPFDLSEGPLLRVSLFTCANNDTVSGQYVLLFTLHHIVTDGWSMWMLLDELRVLYPAAKAGTHLALPPLTHQYSDYVAWQQDMLQREGERLWTYWHSKLAGALEVLNLPTDHPRAPVESFDAASYSFKLSKTLTQSLKALARSEDATLYMLLLATFDVLLYRYTGQEDILVGSPIAGRNQIEFAETVGYFISPVVMRANLSDNAPFVAFLSQVRQTVLEALAHQDYPFPLLVQRLQPTRDPSRSPLFQAVFALQKGQRFEEIADLFIQLDNNRQIDLGGLRLSPFVVRQYEGVFDLMLEVVEVRGALTVAFKYNRHLFDPDTIQRMAGHFESLLEGIVAHPSRPITELPLLTLSERHQLLVEWNNTTTDYPQDKCIHELFEAQVARTPDAVAVLFGEQEVSYRELNRRANQLAHHLITLEVSPDLLVGLMVERSIEMVVGLLGILKAGGAYVPLDPSYPKERLIFMLQDSKVRILLTNEPPEWHDKSLAHVLDLDRQWETEGESNPKTDVTPDNLAYVIYTSGSTGKPKGVLVEHRGLCNLAQAQIRGFEVRPGSRVLQFASLNFDASISEIVISLCSGASLYLAKRDSLLPGPSLRSVLLDAAISHVTLPPSALALLPEEELPALQTLIVAGEACPADLVARWSKIPRFINAYGPTEFTVCATMARVMPSSKEPNRPPIGRPIDNAQVYLLDQHLRPVPVGVPGELHLGGVQVARGYLNRPELTGEKFIPNPYGEGRLYKTGDLCRYLPDTQGAGSGNIEFLGRIDHQVKLRGFRIELGEIEAILNQHPDVRDTVVIAQETASGKRLVAYLTQQETSAPTSEIELWPSVAEYYVYDDLLYYAMTNDERRNQSYKVAINQLVKDKVVVEIGTGKDAILARFCAAAGAKKVYAIERDEEAYQLAKQGVQKLGLSDQIILIHGDATEISLPEAADVSLSEIVGPIGGCEGAAVIINQTRHLLKDNAAIIPSKSITKIAAVTFPDEQQPGFTEVSGYYVQQIFEQIGYPFDVRVSIKNFPKSNLLSNVNVFEELDFTKPIDTDLSHEVDFTISQNGRLDGFLLWLNLHTIAGEEIDILEQEHCWLPVYFPVFDPGILVSPGDIIQAVCTRALCENNLNPDYSISGRLIRADGSVTEFEHVSYHHKKIFKQNPFYERLWAQNADLINQNGLSGKSPVPSAVGQGLVPKVRQFLSEKLPEYMIPGAFVILDALPLTPNGKIDRRALPAPTTSRQVETAYVMPQTEATQQIAAIWQEVLQLEKVGIHDNFFELGGHSLLMIQIQSKLQENRQQKIAMTALFQYPTVHTLAKYLSQQPKAVLGSEQAKLRRTRQSSMRQRRKAREKRRSAQ